MIIVVAALIFQDLDDDPRVIGKTIKTKILVPCHPNERWDPVLVWSPATWLPAKNGWKKRLLYNRKKKPWKNSSSREKGKNCTKMHFSPAFLCHRSSSSAATVLLIQCIFVRKWLINLKWPLEQIVRNAKLAKLHWIEVAWPYFISFRNSILLELT